MTNTNGSASPHAKRIGRELAMQFMFRCDLAGEIPEIAGWEAFCRQLGDELELGEDRYSRKGRVYAERIFTLFSENREEVDAAIRAHSPHWELDRMSAVDRNILRVAAVEMLFVPDVPPVVSIDEAVGIARDFSGDETINFINGVLNAIKDSLSRPAREKLEQ